MDLEKRKLVSCVLICIWFIQLSCGRSDEQIPDKTMTAVFGSDHSTPTITIISIPVSTSVNTIIPTTVSIIATEVSPTYEPVVLRQTFVATYLTNPVILDGDWSEWDSQEYPVQTIIYGNEYLSSKIDLRSSAQFGWDYQFIYLSGKVIDDAYLPNSNQQKSNSGDGVQVSIDTDLFGDLETEAMNYDDYRFLISLGAPKVGENPIAFLDSPNNYQGIRSDVIIRSTAIISDQMGGYYYELAIPWYVLNIIPSPDLRIGIHLTVTDNDEGGIDRSQTIASTGFIGMQENPTTWAELVLSR